MIKRDETEKRKLTKAYMRTKNTRIKQRILKENKIPFSTMQYWVRNIELEGGPSKLPRRGPTFIRNIVREELDHAIKEIASNTNEGIDEIVNAINTLGSKK